VAEHSPILDELHEEVEAEVGLQVVRCHQGTHAMASSASTNKSSEKVSTIGSFEPSSVRYDDRWQSTDSDGSVVLFSSRRRQQWLVPLDGYLRSSTYLGFVIIDDIEKLKAFSTKRGYCSLRGGFYQDEDDQS
jgi:hypothetical protein